MDAKLPQVEEYTEGIQSSKTIIFTSLISRGFFPSIVYVECWIYCPEISQLPKSVAQYLFRCFDSWGISQVFLEDQ